MAPVDGRYSLVNAEQKEEKATLEVLKGRGFVLKFSSHFAVAVIVGVLGWVWHSAREASTPLASTELHQVSQDLAALRADFNQFKLEQGTQAKLTESAINDLKIAMAPHRDYPAPQVDVHLGQQVSKSLLERP